MSDITPSAAAPVAPVADAAPVAPAAPEAPKTESGLPDDVLRIPSMRALLTGSPPAARIDPKRDSNLPELAIIKENTKPLLEAGFDFYQSKTTPDQVMFNTQFVSKKELEAADKAGKLDTIAPPFDELKSFFDQGISGETAPADAPADGAAALPAVSNTPVALPPQPAGSANKITQARLKNLAVGSPTSGPQPGAGRILNNILKPTV